MAEGSLVTIESLGKHGLATISCEKVGQREAQVIEGEIRAALPKHGWRMLIDASRITVLASMGLGTLVTLHKLSSQNGGAIVIYGLQSEIVGLMKLTHLDRILKLVKAREDAGKLLG